MRDLVINVLAYAAVGLALLALAWISGPRAGFYVPAAVALFATLMVVFNTNPVHALLYLVLSLLSVAVIFFVLGAPFAAALEVIVYAGAILVLFVFVVMMLNLGRKTEEQERRWLSPTAWIGPAALAALLLWQLAQQLWPRGGFMTPAGLHEVSAKAVGIALYGPYLLAVELASMMLLAGLVAAYHLGKNE
jgi:NADH-quinone oxidoreductase subunit J